MQGPQKWFDSNVALTPRQWALEPVGMNRV
jgi:hypothetical protein